MTKFTPNNNWPIAEETDIAKQYPATVDEPFKMALDILVPPGAILMWLTATAPDGWRICDGSALARAEYPNLFAAIGIKYGIGDGVTTFAVPNLKGRFPVGFDAAQTEFDTLGGTGGAKTHKHPVANANSIGGAAINMMDPTNTTLFPGARVRASGTINVSAGPAMGAAAQDRYTYDTDDAAGLPPFIIVNFIIKT